MTTPTDAHQSQLALYGQVLLTVAARRQDDLPGLTEVCQDDVLVTAGGTPRAAHGWFAPSAWRYGDRHVHELFLNADRRVPHPSVDPAEDVLVTLLHEACHAWAQANDVQDTSRQGRWHNKRFAKIARRIGLVAEPDSRIGHTTQYSPVPCGDGVVCFGDSAVSAMRLTAAFQDEEVWSGMIPGEVFGSPLWHDNAIFITTGDGELFAFDTGGKGESVIDGRALFEKSGSGASPAAYGSITLAGKYLFLISNQGEAVVLEATRSAPLVPSVSPGVR